MVFCPMLLNILNVIDRNQVCVGVRPIGLRQRLVQSGKFFLAKFCWPLYDCQWNLSEVKCSTARHAKYNITEGLIRHV